MEELNIRDASETKVSASEDEETEIEKLFTW
ncbi:hypothetical protein T472_0202240 [Youngiibacter fragilis 232.1]|uniref:Uncharacterized protein n=1 Tax=Youngiibacter fragilis 232.1 TaxID=994573 RepID=V7IA14_9CLOT|nr:hypothetical protein T472_0202240 [Youngiibacter fragilis 232.1]